MLRLKTLGSLDLHGSSGEERLGSAAQPKRLALLAFLAVEGQGGFQRRDTLIALLWPDLDQPHARAALRKALHHLRQALGPDVVVTRRDEEVRLNTAALWCDAREFTERVASGDYAEAVSLYAGEFMSGLHVEGAAEFEQWLDAQRYRLRVAAVNCAIELTNRCRAACRPLEAVEWARRAVDIEPLDERPNRVLIELLGEVGDRPAALAAYDRFADRLASELDLSPDDETRVVADRLRNSSSRGEKQDSVQVCMAPVSEAWSEKAALRDSAPPVEDSRPSRTWRRRAVLLAVVAFAVASSSAVGWRWRLTELHGTPARASELAVHRDPSRRATSIAYDDFVKGLFHSSRWPYATTEQAAIREFESAIAKDSNFAAAYVGLAEVLLYTAGVSADELERGLVAARRAVQLDPTLPEAHVVLGMARMRSWDWRGSEEAFRRAIALDPYSSRAHQWYTQLLRQMMRLDEASREAKLASELDPLSLQIKTLTVGGVLFNQHRYDEALRVWESVLELDPEYALAWYNQGLAYAMQGRGAEAIKAAQRATRPLARGRYEIATVWLRGLGYALSGERSRADEILQQLETRYSSASRAPGMIAALHLSLGREDRALEWLERGYARHDSPLANITSEPWFDGVRDHPRFRALRAKIGLP